MSDQPSSNGNPKHVNWTDLSVPVGNAPPLPAWPLWLVGLAWIGWIAFLAVMTLNRLQSGA